MMHGLVGSVLCIAAYLDAGTPWYTATQHEVTFDCAAVTTTKLAFEQDAGGGPPGSPDQAWLNEFQAFERTGGVSTGFAYDPAGLLLSESPPSGTVTYTYDWGYRLESRTDASGTTWYFSDALGRRMTKLFPSGAWEIYVYDGEDVIAEYDLGFQLLALYTNGLGIDRKLSIERGGQRFEYVPDALGSTHQLLNGAQGVANQYLDDAWGNSLQATGGVVNRYRYAGRELDAESGNYHNRARFYMPGRGRFGSRDPIRSGGNWWSYGGNNPVNYIDPMGLREMTPEESAKEQAMVAAIFEIQGLAKALAEAGADSATLHELENLRTEIRKEQMAYAQAISDAPEMSDVLLSFAMDVTPLLGDAKGAAEAAQGSDLTGADLSPTERSLGAILIVGPRIKGAGKLIKGGARVRKAAVAIAKLSARMEQCLQRSRTLLQAAKGTLGRLRAARRMSIASPIGLADDLLKYASNVKPKSGFTDVFIHSDAGRFAIRHNGAWVDLTHREVANFIKSKGITGDIRLISCEAGQCGLAQNLANKLGVAVEAATTRVGIYKDRLGEAMALDAGEWKIFSPGVKP